PVRALPSHMTPPYKNSPPRSACHTTVHATSSSRPRRRTPGSIIFRTSASRTQMAAGFRRRLACLTAPRASSYLRRTRHKKLSYARARSASLPGRFHPVVAGLHDAANEVLGWTEAPAQAGTEWIGDGVGHLGRLLAGLTDLLHHPQAQDPLRHSRRPGGKAAAPWAERLLDDLLLLADAHGCFREALLSLKQLL
uniref:Uncharacterized protein n=1 Tax=Aegilops tauschii subsp. strangulata TaxID=200361 RepID=A0A453J2R1_AEGTS